MKIMKYQSFLSGKAATSECDKYFELLNDVSDKQKEATATCTTNYETVVQGINDNTSCQFLKLQAEVDLITQSLQSCQQICDVEKRVSCLVENSKNQHRPISNLSRDSSKLFNQHTQGLDDASYQLDSCNVDVAYFYSDVIDDIVQRQRNCVLYGYSDDYEIPPFKGSTALK